MISFLTSKLWVKLPLQMFTGSVHTSYLGWSPQPSSFPFKNRFRSIPLEKNFASKFWILSQKNRTKSLLFTLHGPPIKMYVVHFASVGISRWLRDGFLIIRFQIKQIILSWNLVFFLPILLENSKRNSKNQQHDDQRCYKYHYDDCSTSKIPFRWQNRCLVFRRYRLHCSDSTYHFQDKKYA